jgi:hypothetical protein
MSARHTHLHRSQRTALDAIAGVLRSLLNAAWDTTKCAAHGAAPAPGRAQSPEPQLIVRVDGHGHSEMLDELEQGMGLAGEAHGAWTVVRFDAWQHQRLAAPWWWLVDALDKQIRADRPRRRPGLRASVRLRSRDMAWRGRQLRKELRIVGPFALVTLVVWFCARSEMSAAVESLATLLTAVTAVATALLAAMKPLRRRLLLSGQPAGAALLRSTDPMADMRARYDFLLREVGTPVLVLIDNLDRCGADYVVDLLEGLQTLLRDAGAGDRGQFVAFVIAADRDWLCRSFLHRYSEFESTGRQPGRLFGQPFLEKIFDLELRLPTIPAALSSCDDSDGSTQEVVNALFDTEVTEGGVRKVVHDAETKANAELEDPERQPAPLQAYRIAAVTRIGELEVVSARQLCGGAMQFQCKDTHLLLEELVEHLDAGAWTSHQLDAAYCVQRTRQLLAGHEIEHTESAIRRLGLWTILSTMWPLLADHLVEHPEDIECLRGQGCPAVDTDRHVLPVFADRAARQLAAGWKGDRLCAADIRRFSAPHDPNASAEPQVGTKVGSDLQLAGLTG